MVLIDKHKTRVLDNLIDRRKTEAKSLTYQGICSGLCNETESKRLAKVQTKLKKKIFHSLVERIDNVKM